MNNEELNDGELLEVIRRENRLALGLDRARGGGMGRLGGTLKDFMLINPGPAGVAMPDVQPYAYGGAGSQQPQWNYRYQPTTVTQLQVDPTNASYVLDPLSGQVVSGMGVTPLIGAAQAAGSVASSRSALAQKKGQLTEATNQVVKFADSYSPSMGMDQLVFRRQALEGVRSQLSSLNWDDWSFGVFGPAYDKRSTLMEKLQQAQSRLIGKSGQMREDGAAIQSRQTVSSTGQVRQDSQLAAAGGSLYRSASDTAGQISKGNWFEGLGISPWKVAGVAVVGLGIYAFASGAGSGLTKRIFGGGRKKNPGRDDIDCDEDDGDEEAPPRRRRRRKSKKSRKSKK